MPRPRGPTLTEDETLGIKAAIQADPAAADEQSALPAELLFLQMVAAGHDYVPGIDGLPAVSD